MNNKRPHSSVYGAPPQPAQPAALAPMAAGPQQPAQPAGQPAPDYSAAWAQYYAQQAQQQAAAARPQQSAQYAPQVQAQVPAGYGYAQPAQPPAPSPYAMAPNPYAMPGQPQPQYGGPQHPQQPQQHRPPQQQQQQPYMPQGQPQQQPYVPQQTVVGYSQGGPILGYTSQPQQQPPYQQGGGPAFSSRPAGPNVPQRGIPAPPSHLPRPPTAASAAALLPTPMGHQSPSGSSSSGFPPAKRPRFDHGPPEGDYPSSSSYGGQRPSGLPVNPPGVNSMPLGAGGGYGPRNGPGGGGAGVGGGGPAEYFGGVPLSSGDGRDGLGMSMRNSRGADRGGFGASPSLPSRVAGGRGYDDMPIGGGYGGRGGGGRGRGSRNSPPPGLGGPGMGRGGIGMGLGGRGDRGGFRGRGGRGAFQANMSTVDAPRGPRGGPSGGRGNTSQSAAAAAALSAANAEKARAAKEKDDSKRTLTDFKIVGLELPELLWKWGSVPEKEREEEGKKRKADGTGSEVGDDSPSSPSSSSHATKHRNYFMTHGKENSDAVGSGATKEISRLRVYFDSPAGHGPGEKRGRGGIEGLRERPAPPTPAAPAPPPRASTPVAETDPAPDRDADAKTETAGEDEDDLDGAPMEETEVGALLEDTEQDVDDDQDQQKPSTEELQQESASTEDAPKAESADDGGLSTSTAEPASEATNVTQPITTEAEEPAEDASSSTPLVAADATAAEDVPEDTDAGDISMTSARSSLEPTTAATEDAETTASTAVIAPEGLAPDSGTTDQPTTTVIPQSVEPSTSMPSVASSVVPSPSPAPSAAPALSAAPSTSTSSRKKGKNGGGSGGNAELKAEKSYPVYDGPEPSANRVSILYERCTRRICIDAEVVERVRVSRAEGKVEFTIRWRQEISSEPETEASAKVEEIPEPPVKLEAEGIKSEEQEADVKEGESQQEETGMEAMKESTPAPASAPGEDAVIVKVETEDDKVETNPTEDKPETDDETKQDATTTSTPAPAEDSVPKEDKKSAAEPSAKGDNRRWDICRGILMELLDEETETFRPVDLEGLDDMWDGVTDPTAGWTPPIHQFISPNSDPQAAYPELRCDTFKIIAYLDQEKPLSEPKWIKTGNVEDWLNDIFGAPGKKAGGKGLAWRGKFEILDPEQVSGKNTPASHPPTIQTTLDSWAMNSTAGTARERRRFVKTHLVEMDHILEILLRLVRGDRVASATASQTTTPTSLSGPLATAVTEGSHYAKTQNHVSLSVLALLKLTHEMAEKAGVKSSVVDERVSEIIRALPQHLIFKSVDGLFREWLADKKH